MTVPELPASIARGWRRSASGGLYRRLGGWCAVVTVTRMDGPRITLIPKKPERTLEDAVDLANGALEVLRGDEEKA